MGLVDLNKTSALQLAPGISAKVISATTVTVAHVTIAKDALLPEHQHHNEQVVNVIEGELELTVAGQAHRLTVGQSFILAPNMPHSGRAISDCKVIDVFHPVREDFKAAAFSAYDKK